MFGKQHFYLMYGPLATKDEKLFKKWVAMAETGGIRPISYKYDKLVEANSDAFVMGVTLIECRELWHGSLKRWLRHFDMQYTNHEKDGLRIYA